MTVTEKHNKALKEHPHKVQIEAGKGEGATFIFQPGDGTRYSVLVRHLSDSECSVFGCSEGSRMFAINRGPNKFVAMCSADVPHRSYLQEKLGLREYESVAWEYLLNFVVHGKDFTKHDWVKGLL